MKPKLDNVNSVSNKLSVLAGHYNLNSDIAVVIWSVLMSDHTWDRLPPSNKFNAIFDEITADEACPTLDARAAICKEL